MGDYEISVEIKSVNHRYFEYASRLPRAYNFLDDKLKSALQSRISRGKVEISLSVQRREGDDTVITVDEGKAAQYVNSLRAVSEKLGLKDDLSLSVISRFQDIYIVEKAETDEEALTRDVLSVTEEALDRFIAMRETEGAKMLEDLSGRLDTIREKVAFVEERSPETVKAYRTRLYDKLTEVLSDTSVDEQRILTEAAIYADRVAVDEETVRLRSHLEQFENMLKDPEPVGRRLDFLVQEMNRETNTIGSKASDLAIARVVVDIKAEIEKIREQIQNIE